MKFLCLTLLSLKLCFYSVQNSSFFVVFGVWCVDEETASEKNTIVFKLDVVCTRRGERVMNASGWTFLLAL